MERLEENLQPMFALLALGCALLGTLGLGALILFNLGA